MMTMDRTGANPRLDADNLKDLVIIVHYEIS